MSTSEPNAHTPRREFLSRAVGGAALLATAPLLASCEEAEESKKIAPVADEAWLKPLAGKHKQVFDAPATNGGFPLLFAFAYIGTMTAAYKLEATDVNAIIVARHMGVALVLNDAVWAKYKLGKFFNVMDPATKKPSERNIFYNSKPGDILNEAASADKLIAKGVVIAACNVALTVLSGMAATAAGLKPETAYDEWKAGLIQGAQIVPSGVLAVGRAQEHGCTYCFAG